MTANTKQKIAFIILLLCALSIILPVLFIIGIIIKNGASAINWEFLSTAPQSGMRQGGIFPAILGTLILVSSSILIALPLGVFSAIYLSEYAQDSPLARIIKLAIVNLAGVPSVVYGLFGLSLFVIYFKFGVSILSGALTLAIMQLPVIIVASYEALRSVPESFREVSLSLGASRWQTVRYAVLPYAISGILTGSILSVSRIAGETAPILFTVAAFYLPHLPHSIFDQVMTLPYHLYVISTQIPNISLEVRYGTALVLIAMVFIMNLVAVIIRMQFRKQKKW